MLISKIVAITKIATSTASAMITADVIVFS